MVIQNLTDADIDRSLARVRELLGVQIVLPDDPICHKCEQPVRVALLLRGDVLLCFRCQDKVEAERARNAAEDKERDNKQIPIKI